MSVEDLNKVLARLEAVTARLEKCGSSGGAGGEDEVAEFVTEFDSGLLSSVTAWVDLSNGIGGDVQVAAGKVKTAFDNLRQFLVVVSKCKMAKPEELQVLLKPLSNSISDVQDFREKNRASKLFNHLSTLSEGIPALGWVTVSPKPVLYMKDIMDSSLFYSNRVIKDHKESDPNHVEWVRAWKKMLDIMQAYVTDYHKTGVTWKRDGKSVSEVQAAGAGAAPPAPPAPPAGGPPPPPPPPPPADLGSAPAGDSSDSRAALFSALNKGADVTKGLKKVSDDQKTHKNPALRTGPAPFKPHVSPKPAAAPKPLAKPSAKPPVFELQMGKKWVVEHQNNNKTMTISDGDIKQSVYMYKCENCVLQVKGKLNSITMDSCKKTGIVFEDLLGCFEFVNCQSVQCQVEGKVPTISVDKTDGCQIYLKESGLGAQIIAAKSSEMNILIVSPDGDVTETALPEQFKSIWDPAKKTWATMHMDLNL